MELNIEEILWLYLSKGQKTEPLSLSLAQVESCFDQGLVEQPKFTKKTWVEAWQKYWQEEEAIYQLNKKDLIYLKRFLYSEPINQPFKPENLPDQKQPKSWFLEMYHKVLRFETSLELKQWIHLLEGPLKQKFFYGEKYNYNSKFKNFLKQLLKKKPSVIRHLECLVESLTKPQLADPFALEKGPKKTPTVLPSFKDAYQGREKENKLQSLHKTYYEETAKKPALKDEESLDFLEEIVSLEEEKDDQVP
ncbi:MAG: hypothetical protein KDK66_04435 [Deltaproteobacteria bacterium]|nr:hypothetical protein [Deltaproteobacteria bacterium]